MSGLPPKQCRSRSGAGLGRLAPGGKLAQLKGSGRRRKQSSHTDRFFPSRLPTKTYFTRPMGPWQTIPIDMTGVPRASQPLRIFVVEDHADTLHALCLYLEHAGFSVWGARSKEEALNKIANANCDVLISDIRLSDGNGWDLIQKMGKLRPRYAIAISGYGTKADREKSAQVGFRQHLVKPISSKKLAAVFEEADAQLRAR